jgi:2-oxoglutarate dehydrogenase N-terminus
MSAVSSESPLAASDLSAPSAHSSSPAQPDESAEPGATPANADFGPNEWLVDELYQRYLTDPGSVDKAWWSFFADYRPVRSVNGTGSQPVLTEERPARPAVKEPAPKAASASQPAAVPPPADADVSKLRGAAARTA